MAPKANRSHPNQLRLVPLEEPTSALKSTSPGASERSLDELTGRSLSDAQLLARILDVAEDDETPRRLLRNSRGVGLLPAAANTHAFEDEGLDLEQRTRLLAALELTRRIHESAIDDPTLLDKPAVIAEYLFNRYARIDQEVFGALFLDIRNRLIAEREIFRGHQSRLVVSPRPILAKALRLSASGIALWHTHPTGDPSPSKEDEVVTKKFYEACELLGIKLLDHIILGSTDRWVALSNRGNWPGRE